MAFKFYVIGGILVSIGVLGFVMPAPLFGLLSVTPTLNIWHVLSGIYALSSPSRGIGAMRSCGKVLGFAYAVFAATNFVLEKSPAPDLVAVSEANGWFHLVTSLVFLYYALLAPPR